MSVYLRTPKRILLRKLFVGLLLFSAGATVAYFFYFLAPLFADDPRLRHPLVPVLIMTVLSLICYKTIDRWVQIFFKKTIFRETCYAHLTLMDLAKELRLVLDLKEFANLVVNSFGEVLRLKTVVLVALNSEDDKPSFEAASSFGWAIQDAKKLCFNHKSPIVRLMKKNGNHTLIRGVALKSFMWEKSAQLESDFNELQAGWVVPLFVHNELLGFLAFGDESPNRTFEHSDFHFFREFSQIASQCLRNALEFSKIQKTNVELSDSQSKSIQLTKVKSIEQLAAGISHEIHNPLTIISGKAQMMLFDKGLAHCDPKFKDSLEVIVNQTKRAADITRKLMSFSQGTGVPQSQMDLGRVLEETIALMKYQVALDQIHIISNIEEGVPEFWGNIGEIREIFLNLLMNSIQSVGRCGEIKIYLNYADKKGVIEVSFTDTGIGIDEKDIEHLFDPFFTTRHESMGLGLFVVKQIMHRYGGAIRVDSRSGEGSVFTLQFPVAKTAKTVQPEPEVTGLLRE